MPNASEISPVEYTADMLAQENDAAPSSGLDHLVSSSLADHNDKLLEAANAFDVQLQNLNSWKQQLSSQMDLLRRDGVRLLEKQKELATQRQEIEAIKNSLSQDRATLEEQRTELGEQRKEFGRQQKNLAKKAQELTALESHKDRWLAQMAEARQTLEQLAVTQTQTNEKIDELEKRAAELAALENQKDFWLEKMQAAQQALEKLAADQAALAEAQKLLAEQVAAADVRNQYLDNLDAQLKSRQEQLSRDAEALGADRRTLADNNGQLEEKIERFNQHVQEEEKAIALLRQSMQEQLNAEAQALKGDLKKQYETREEELTGRLLALAQEAQCLQQRRAEIEAEAQHAHAAVEERAAALTRDAMRDLASQQEALAQEQQTFHQRQEELTAELEQQIRQARELSEAHEVEESAAISTLKQQLADLTAQHAARVAEASEYEAAALTFKREVDRLREQLAGANQEVQSLRDAVQKQTQAGGVSAAGDTVAADAGQPDGATSAQAMGDAGELQEQLRQARAQYAQLAARLEEIESRGRARLDDATLGRAASEANSLLLTQRTETLEKLNRTLQDEKAGLEKQVARLSSGAAKLRAADGALGRMGQDISGVAEDQLKLKRQRISLLKQARTLRARSVEIRDARKKVVAARQDVARQRDQIRIKRDNLEQVQRLLEKQEMVMARKLADQSALKTVAAVGIFVVMVLGSTVAGVYSLARPRYESAAIVQLQPPAALHGTARAKWFNGEKQALRGLPVLNSAWQILARANYGGQNTRRAFISSLANDLHTRVDAKAGTMSVHYASGTAKDSAAAANALARGFVIAGAVKGAKVLAPAVQPQYAARDNRWGLILTIDACVFGAAAIAVVLLRQRIAAQLRQIDGIADDADLADVRDELPETAPAA